MSSLYERLGGADAIDAAVDVFYGKILEDERVSHFFETVDMDKQREKQKRFLSMVTGGPHQYTGRSMRQGHKHLLKKGLNDSHVDIVIEHLGNTLKELGVSDAEISEVAAIANGARDDVLSR